MVFINNKFMKHMTFGLKIAEKLCLGWKVTVVIEDVFGNGHLLFEHNEFTSVFVPFERIDVSDVVVVEYNKLGEVVKDY